MNNDLTKPGQDSKAISPQPDQPRILDRVYEKMSPEQREKLLNTAGEQALIQELKDLEAKRRFMASGADMQRHVDLVREHEEQKSDFTITSDFKTASGKTTVRVSKANNTLFIVIAVVIAVIFFAVFAR